MKRKNATRNALITSILSLLLCVSMLVGTTFAWFTDEVTSGINTIQSGNLDVVLEYKTNWSDDWAPVDATTKVFKEGALYEPGYTEVVFLRVSNAGSLALKYNLTVNVAAETGSTNVADEAFKLSDYLQVGYYHQDEFSGEFNYADILIPAMFGTRETALSNVTLGKLADFDGSLANAAPLLPGDKTAQVVALVLTMPETVGNEANHKTDVDAPSIQLGINLIAAQYTHEEDSFDNQYDAGTSLPGKFEIETLEDLEQAMASGGSGTVMNDIIDVYAELPAGNELALNLNGMTLTGTENNYVIVNNGDLTVTGNGTITSNLHGSIENWGSLLVNDLALNVSGEKYGFHCKAGEVVINNIDLLAERGGVNVQGGKVIINSGSVTTTSYGTKIGYLVYAASNDSAEVIIEGGDFRYVPGYYRHGVLYAGQNASIVVNGGTFGKGGSNTAKTKWITEASGGTVTIYGGTFEFDPTEFVAEGYQAVLNDDGWYTVSAIAG